MKTPVKLGVTVLDDYNIADLIPYIDWTPFFMTWRLRGAYPAIFKDPEMGEECQETF